MGDASLIFVAAGALLGVLTIVLVALMRMHRRVSPDSALVISSTGAPRVSFRDTLVLPLHHAEALSLAVQPIVIERQGAQGIVCRDSIRADLRATFLVRVNRTPEDVLRAATTVGCARASDPAALHAIFAAKFTDALALVAGKYDFAQLHAHRDEFRDQVLEVIGRDLQGFVLDDLAIDRLEHTPIDRLDPNDLFDAEGIRKLTEQTSRHNIQANELRKREAGELAHQNMIAEEQALRIERQRLEAEAHHRQQLALAGLSPPPPANR